MPIRCLLRYAVFAAAFHLRWLRFAMLMLDADVCRRYAAALMPPAAPCYFLFSLADISRYHAAF